MKSRYVNSHIGIIALILLALSGCAAQPVRVAEVPVRIACVTSIPAKPIRLTPCPREITDSQCIKRAGVDIERLDSALDQANELLRACQ